MGGSDDLKDLEAHREVAPNEVPADTQEEVQEVSAGVTNAVKIIAEAIDITDYKDYKAYILQLNKDGFKLMYQVPNDLVQDHIDLFNNDEKRRFKAVRLVTVFNDPTVDDPKHRVDSGQTAIWYKSLKNKKKAKKD